MNRKPYYSNYIEIENKKKTSNVKLFKSILDKIGNNLLSINDFYIEYRCNIEKFIIYNDKINNYLKLLPYIEIELIKLYNEGKITYVGYQ